MDKKIVFVTGVSRGIGLEIAKCFSNNGYFVLGTSRSDFDLAKVLSSDECLHLQLDVTDRNQISVCLDQLKVIDKVPNVLINNAGITKDQLFLRMKNEDWDDVLEVNMTASMILCRAAMRPMMKARSGRIISISSVVGVTGNPGQANYAASKAGMIGFSKSLAAEVASRGITVNIVAPGFIETPMTDVLNASYKEKLLGSIPMKRMGKPAEIAAGAVFLASDASSYVTGTTLHMNGGMFCN